MNDDCPNDIGEVLRQHGNSINLLTGRIHRANGESNEDAMVGEICSYPGETFQAIMTAVARTLIAQGRRVTLVTLITKEGDKESDPQIFYGSSFGIVPDEILSEDMLTPIRLLIRRSSSRGSTKYTFFV